MSRHIDKFYRRAEDETPNEKFHEVIALHSTCDIAFGDLLKKMPSLPQGWYELAQLNSKDRIEFVREFWFSKLPYHPLLNNFLQNFFSSLDDISIYIVQQKLDDPFEAEMVYSLRDDSGFFRGSIPASEEDIAALQKNFPEYILPADYIAFLQIHNGFCKATDCSGVMKCSCVYEKYLELQQSFAKEETLMTISGKSINPKSLIPFYKSFGHPYYQCFWGEWYPEQEMGNVYYSSATNRVSEFKEDATMAETMAFATFIDWLLFYLERIA